MSSVASHHELDTSRGKKILLLLCAVAFLDFVDASIVNVALPSIREDLGFSIQNLQWVLSGYLLTYGGFVLLGGRAADLLGRRRVLVAGTVLFTGSSLTAGLAQSDVSLIASRLIQGVGAAMMIPAALSLLTTTFTVPEDRHKALGAWGAVAGIASAVGVFLGGLLSEVDWRLVFFVNLPACVVIVRAIFALLPPDPPRARILSFDALGAVLATGGMLALVYTIIEAPSEGWGSTRTVASLAGAAAILGLFALNELRHRNPLFPFSIFRIPGLAAADVTQVVAMAGFYSTFFFMTLYMQNVLGYSQLGAGAAYIPVTLGVVLSAGVATALLGKIGTRPLVVGGAVLGAVGIFWVSHIPVHGSYLTDVLPGLMVMSLGLGAVFVAVTTAAQAGVPADRAGLAAALINSSTWIGGALGIAIFSAIATSQTTDLLATGATRGEALTGGFQDALTVAAAFLAAAAVIALRAPDTRGAPGDDKPAREELCPDAMPATELA